MISSNLIIVVLITILIGVLIAVYFDFDLHPHPKLELSADQVRTDRSRFRIVIDVRDQKERELHGFYPNSIPIEINQLKKEVPFLIGSGLQSLQTPILIYSNEGDHRSKKAAELLFHLGYKNVKYISKSYQSLLP